MAMTEFALGDALAVQRWSESLDYETAITPYFSRFMGKGRNNVIVVREELSRKAGEKIIVGLKMKLSGDGIEADNGLYACNILLYANGICSRLG